MKKILFLKTSLCLICILLISILVQYAGRMMIEKELRLTKTYIAARDIAPRHQITREDLIELRVPGIYTDQFAFSKEEDIIGKYTDIQGKIPAGSLFYKSMLYDAESMPDHAAALLKKGQSSFSVSTDVSTLGSIIPGMRVDVYAALRTKNDDTALTGRLLQNARVTAVKDHQGLSLDDENGTGIPYITEIAVNREDLQLLTMAESGGEIRLFPADDPYETEKEAERDPASAVVKYLLSAAKDQNR